MQDITIQCPLPGCTDTVQKSLAMLHVRHQHPELAKLKETVTCPKCQRRLLGANYPKHYIIHFPSYTCPYGCGGALARITVAERRRHYYTCPVFRRTGISWEEADARAIENSAIPMPMKPVYEARRRRPKTDSETAPAVHEEPRVQLEPDSEDDYDPATYYSQASSTPAPVLNDDAETDSGDEDSRSDTSVEMSDAKIWSLDGKYE